MVEDWIQSLMNTWETMTYTPCPGYNYLRINNEFVMESTWNASAIYQLKTGLTE